MKKIAFIGAGAIGSVVGGYLKKGGADVYFVDPYKAHMDAIKEHGLVIKAFEGEKSLGEVKVDGIHTSYTTEGLPVMDAVIILVKSSLTEQALDGAKPIIGDHTILMSMQNGLGHPEELIRRVPANRVLCGTIKTAGRMEAPGVVIGMISSTDNVCMGPAEKSAATDEMGEYLAKCFNAADLSAHVVDNINDLIWEKVILNCVINATSAVTRMPQGRIFMDPSGNGKMMMTEIAREAAAVAHGKGAHIDIDKWLKDFLPHHMETMPNHFPSMAQDLFMMKRVTEVDFLNGKVAEYGKELGIPTPFNLVISTIIRTIQNNFSLQYVEGK